MNTRAWLVLLLFLGWSAGGWYWYTCQIKGYCYSPGAKDDAKSTPVITEDPVESVKQFAPLTFKKEGFEALTTDEWPTVVDELLARSEEGKQLTISGAYYVEETNNSSFENLGLARAFAAKALLAEKYDTALVKITAHLMDGNLPNKEQFEGATVNWLTNTTNVKQLVDGALIYFPYKSDEKIDDPDIAAYLDEMVTTLSNNQQHVEIIGHTDDKGSAGYNLKLGQERADAIKAILVSKGIDVSRVSARSKGESDPMVPNTTEENKAKNRRTEIKIR